MAIRDIKGKVEDLVPVKNVLVSVSDKTGLEDFVPGLIEASPDVRFISTGGTYTRVAEILEGDTGRLIDVEEYTGFPAMEGGLVKTLHPKIHAGILGERNNPEHQRYLKEDVGGGVFIDMVVVNLYPFKKVIAAEDSTFESARGNIDIGGAAMLRAAAKNFLGCAPVCDPSLYGDVLSDIKINKGSTSLGSRFWLAGQAFQTTAEYDGAVSVYLQDRFARNLGKIFISYLGGNDE